MNRWAVAVLLASISFYFHNVMYSVLSVLGYGSVIFLGILFGFGTAILTGKKHSSKNLVVDSSHSILKDLLHLSQSEGLSTTSVKRQAVFTRNIDAAIDQILDFTIRDYIVSWLKELIRDYQGITDNIKEDLWFSIVNVKDRLNRIDQVKFITNDVTWKLCQHYQMIRLSSINGREKRSTFSLRPYLETEESEMEFLRKVSELLIVLLAPRTYAQSMPVRHLFREIIVSSVLYPTINMICDPDYINQKLLGYLLYHQELMEQHKKTYTYAATYEGFVKLIQECSNLEQLKHVRYNIMTEIMHATTINNLKKSKGIDVEKEFISQGMAKGDLLQARNLKRYINQLTFAKALCEKRLVLLGGPDYSAEYIEQNNSGLSVDELKLLEYKVLSHSVMMESDFARSFFIKFLSRDDAQFLLEFYVAVEELRECNKKKIHQLASEIFKVYMPYVSATVKLDRSILKGMEAFMIGNKGPEAFIDAQEETYKFLEERYYPSFIVSDVYHKMLIDADKIGIDFNKKSNDTDDTDNTSGSESTSLNCANVGMQVSDHHSYAKAKLEQLDDKLTIKLQASDAVKSSLLGENAKVVIMLEKEIETLKSERRLLTLHIERTDLWSRNLGCWRVHVHSIEMIEEKDWMVPLFLLVVQLNVYASSPSEDEDDENDLCANSWVVKRRISDFHELSQRLFLIGSWIKSITIPKENKIRTKGLDRISFDKTISMLQKFMDAVMADDTMSSSEAVYAFLNPSPEHLKQCIPSPKRSKFFLTTFFKSAQNSNSQGDGSDDDEFLFFDDIDNSLKDDRIAEPLYALMGEIFDMRGVFKLLRRTLISFVQITFGRTINRQLRDTVSWLFSESMVVYYLNLFCESMWPGGATSVPSEARSDEQKLETRCQAKQQLLNSIPEILSNLVGQQNAKKGARKVFESLQDARLNKQLLYELMEMLILELFPEIKS